MRYLGSQPLKQVAPKTCRPQSRHLTELIQNADFPGALRNLGGGGVNDLVDIDKSEDTQYFHMDLCRYDLIVFFNKAVF